MWIKFPEVQNDLTSSSSWFWVSNLYTGGRFLRLWNTKILFGSMQVRLFNKFFTGSDRNIVSISMVLLERNASSGMYKCTGTLNYISFGECLSHILYNIIIQVHIPSILSIVSICIKYSTENTFQNLMRSTGSVNEWTSRICHINKIISFCAVRLEKGLTYFRGKW